MKADLDATRDFTYDDWLEFFRKLPVKELLGNRSDFKETLSTEAFAALSRWVEILDSPSKMDKLYSARLKAQNEADIMDIAVGDDDEAFYEALIRQNVAQLDTANISQQEVARLTQNINIFRKELRDIRSRKPKEGTVLERVLKAASEPKKPVPKKASSAGKTAAKTKTAGKAKAKNAREKKEVAKDDVRR